MQVIKVDGGKPLNGEVTISGAKNSALPIMAATLMTNQPVILDRIPDLKDISVMNEILTELGASVIREPGGRMITRVVNESKLVAPYDLVKKMRGSFCVLGPLLAKRGYAKVSLPGGCVIGTRGVELHIKGLEALGAKFSPQKDGYLIATSPRGGLRGARVYLGGNAGSTVLGTANVISAAALAKGRTTICHAAQEPEVTDLAELLNKMGAQIRGAGTSTIEIDGVETLHGCSHEIIPDRIEAGTWIAAVAMAGGDIIINAARADFNDAVIDRFNDAGLDMDCLDGDRLRVRKTKRLKPINVTALPYPGFPTDMQAQVLAALTTASGASIITDRVFPERFMHVPELNRMGANIQHLPGSSAAIIMPVKRLQAASVMASDLRASAALVIAALAAKGVSTIGRIYHLDRGYERLESKLTKLGATIWREEESDSATDSPTVCPTSVSRRLPQVVERSADAPDVKRDISRTA